MTSSFIVFLNSVSSPSECLAVLDAGITLPAAQGAGEACVQLMIDRKTPRIDRELEDAGIECRPIAFSYFGRLQADAARLIQSLAKQHTRREGSEQCVEQNRLVSCITTEIWRRAACMVRKCTPEGAARALESKLTF